jgi:hypothetical protein
MEMVGSRIKVRLPLFFPHFFTLIKLPDNVLPCRPYDKGGIIKID